MAAELSRNTETDETVPVLEAPLLPEQTNEALLAELCEVRRKRRVLRKTLIGAFAGYMIIYTASMVLYVFQLSHRAATPYYVPVWLTYLLFMGGMYGANWFFYDLQAKKANKVIAALAQRNEIRALGPLLEIMDTRVSGTFGWGKNRAVYIDAVARLLGNVTPEVFQELSEAQIHQLTPLLLMPEPALYTALQDAFIRAGDARALRAIERMRRVSSLQKTQKWNPTFKPMVRLMKKWNWPVYDAEGIQRIETCIASMTERIQADQRNAQLLRASDGFRDDAAEMLLRAAQSSETTSPINELLRAATPHDGSEADQLTDMTPDVKSAQKAYGSIISSGEVAEIPCEHTLMHGG